jgi:3-oxoacyl-[acyl-carrier protein] reductase
MYDDLQNKYAIIVGAGSGIGKSLFEESFKYSLIPIAITNDESHLQDLTYEEKRYFFVADAADSNQIEIIFNKFANKPVVGLINCATVFCELSIETITKDHFKSVFMNNFYSYLNATQKYLKIFPILSKSVVNISSIKGFLGQGVDIPYSVSKAAIIQLSKDFAALSSKYNTRFNTISPGHINTQNNEVHLRRLFGENYSRDSFLNQVPLRRGGSPSEVAKLCLFLISNSSSYINGANIVIDGGFSSSLR